MPPPRLRFAPSPTGYFHVGGARTALYNWLHARQHGGELILRIEDTDTERNKEEWVDGILSAMRWLGLDWDGEPVRQSARTAMYVDAARRLYEAGLAYACDCTREQVEARTRGNKTPGYDGFCRDRGLPLEEGYALRFRTPDTGTTTVIDLIRGTPTFEHSTIEDFVLLRSNGSPMFILANVVDDADLGITHVVRGEEHLSNTPKAVLLWEALDPARPLPVFAHIPLLVNEKRQKLSKRRDPVALELYRDQGFLPEPMRNYLALLGWAPDDGREVLSLDELLAEFRLEDVNNSPAFFDVQKLTHFNAEHIRSLPVAEFIAVAQPWADDIAGFDPAAFATMAPLVQERVKTLSEVPQYVDFLFLDEPVFDDTAWASIAGKDTSAAILDDAIAEYPSAAWEATALHDLTLAIGGRHGLKLGKAQAPIRVAVTGRTVGPPLFESLVVLGRDRTLTRLRAARDRL
jgi:glutamyl-tRNA synthetase